MILAASDPARALANFYESELTRALDEQTFGITASQLVRSTAHDATAIITLQEGEDIEVMLFSVGYKIMGRASSESKDASDVVYETIEDLLGAVSPLYAAKRMESLMEKLARLSQ
ncbi:hypothetical protein BV25DRAFT_1818426 [Artomyces pyxidatus]|uniref:Uncharacterized protein n=1 Tax=Artomyces pyxidatus TaxID=48021 RepID=A0ACB8TI03_9AGAM|nr:hypothetical protein BV25DRAFT_1818426 [Artomyces pyxidatus]